MILDTFRVVKLNRKRSVYAHSAKITHLTLYRDSVLTQLPLGSRLLLRLGQDVKPRAAEDLLKLRMQKSKVLIFSRTSDTETWKAIIQISRSVLGGGGKLEPSVLFIIIKIWLFLCSHRSSPHALILPPES